MAISGIIGKIGRPLQIFKVLLYIFNSYFKKFSGTSKIMPIANVNRIVFEN